MGGKYKIHPAEVLVLAGLYAASLMIYLLLLYRPAGIFCHCGYKRHCYAPETAIDS